MSLIKEGWKYKINTNRKYLIYPFMPKRKQLTLIYGDSGVGKDFIILDMALHIISGKDDWHGYKIDKTNNNKICIFSPLIRKNSFDKRIDAWLDNYGFTTDILKDHLYCYYFKEFNKLDILDENKQNIFISNLKEELGEDISMLVFDYTDFLDIKEKKFIEFCNILSFQLNCNVVVLCDAKIINDVPIHFIEYPNVIIRMTKNKDMTRNVYLYKDRDNKDGYPIMKFKLKQVSLGKNVQERDVTSCIIEMVKGKS